MGQTDRATLLQRIDQLLSLAAPSGEIARHYEVAVESLHGAVTLARLLYGDSEETPQVHTLMKAAQAARADPGNPAMAFHRIVLPPVRGALRAMRSDLELGLVGTVERRAVGDVVGDFLGLAREALADGSDGAKNVAAVLVAAAFEDTVRKMGSTLGGTTGRPDLADVLKALKDADVLQGATVAVAQGFLKFRNDSLHADWAKLKPEAVESCLVLTERLLLAHFA